jgi:two-component system, OmpR family, sensor histidine kinase KdpD
VGRVVTGSALALILALAFGAGLFPLRSQLSISTTALVLVIPVVVGVAVGGFGAGVVGAVAGFLIYDLVFIPPYYTLAIDAAQNWVGLGVYAIVTVVVTRVVAAVGVARSEAQERATELRRLFDLSELLVRESPMPQLLDTVVVAVQQAFSLDGAALLLPIEGRLRLMASAGLPLTEAELQQLSASVPVPVSLETAIVAPGNVQAVALAVANQAIGLLALRGLKGAKHDHELLRAFANHLALALQRAQLREQAVRAQLLDEIDRLRRALVGAVSHDLRTPLATIKVAASTLLDSSAALSGPDAKELLGLIDLQADRLNRLVSNLLDMTRIQSGALELRRARTALPRLLEDALSALGSSAEVGRVQWEAPLDLPDVDVDPLLICQVLANLIDNATRYAPGDTEVAVTARRGWGPHVEVAVSDQGPGVAESERATIFRLFNPSQAGGRGGLGLAIAQAFVEAHGERIWLDRNPGPGARFVFTLPIAGDEEAV